jgi:DNA-directed RNA polymerase subunit RPC12/RpoP
MENEFFTIAAFDYTAEAQVMKGKFMSHGIEVFLKDEHTLDADPLISQAIGGVKLQVRRKDSAEAIALYNELREYEVDRQGKRITCPKCQEDRVLIAPTKKSIFYLLFPFFESTKYQCSKCSEIFKSN